MDVAKANIINSACMPNMGCGQLQCRGCSVIITEPPIPVESQWTLRIPGKFPRMSQWVPLVSHPIPTLFLPHSHLIPSAFLVDYFCTTLIVRCQIFMFVYVSHVTYDMTHNLDLVWHHFFSTFQWYAVWHVKTVLNILSCMVASSSGKWQGPGQSR